MDKKPKKKRKKRPAIKVDPIRVRRYFENRARVRKYYDNIASGSVDDQREMPLKLDEPSFDPKEHMAYLKKGSADGFPSASAMAAHYCIDNDYPMEPWVKDWILEHLSEYIWQNPGMKQEATQWM